MRTTDESPHPAALKRESDRNAAKVRLVGSVILGLLALWNLVRHDILEGVAEPGMDSVALWLSVFAFSWGLNLKDVIDRIRGR